MLVCDKVHFKASGLAASRMVTITPPGRMAADSRLIVSWCSSWKWSFICRAVIACLRRFCRSETVKMMKKAAAKMMPLTVAMDLVNRFTMAVESRTRKTEISPIGISVLPMRILGGTFQPRSPLYFQRSTSMARLLKVNDQITPKAYASPRVITLPRLTMMVIICRMKTRLTMRELVPNF